MNRLILTNNKTGTFTIMGIWPKSFSTRASGTSLILNDSLVMRCPLYVIPRCRHSVGNIYGDLTPYEPDGTTGEHNFAFCKEKNLLSNQHMNTFGFL